MYIHTLPHISNGSVTTLHQVSVAVPDAEQIQAHAHIHKHINTRIHTSSGPVTTLHQVAVVIPDVERFSPSESG